LAAHARRDAKRPSPLHDLHVGHRRGIRQNERCLPILDFRMDVRLLCAEFRSSKTVEVLMERGKEKFIQETGGETPAKVTCATCSALVVAQWVEQRDLSPGITLLGSSICSKCNSPSLHVNGDPEAVALVAIGFQEFMDAKLSPAFRLTDTATGKQRLDG
jgi:hypothetical protein